ncbi:helix-turn-helix domain-containing protein [Polyangium sp. 15x6]|uniref:helix-turn-helix domain-containing protein n=1 Tax=Polyangium sp. 15x6 TaxID=3042687 RepID=UPI00249CC2E0|nr:helix-turn-helix domain-containing protein [Polyangium sp. 15x6]MDI3287809.1 helix-turn-helix domain-containing protein [Polyangium sp. 15x6]
MNELQLFLAHADDQRPVLDGGLPLAATLDAPGLDAPPETLRRVANLQASPDALPGQRWALVAPKGLAGDRLLSLLAPLRKKREEEQGEEAIVYRVDPGMDPVAAGAWIQKEYRDAVRRREAERPRYLLLLGGPELISWDLQRMLGGEAFVGRLAFRDDSGYEAYVDKAIRFADVMEVPRARVLYHAVLDGTRAMQEGDRYLVQPSLAIARQGQAAGTFDADEIVEIPTDPAGTAFDSSSAAGVLLREAARTRAGMLFTMSHGAGIPKAGWRSLEEQYAHQGAMVLGREGDLLTANDIRRGPFLPGGVWFMFACYGAGTPSRSAYLPWLSRLHELGVIGSAADQVLAALPRGGDPPFVAALPQAALANPDGPLGVVGHVDLAWTWSFLDYDIEGGSLVPKSRAERFQGILQALVHGHRFGVAHHELARFFRSVSTEVTIYDEERAHRASLSSDFVEDQASRVRRANLWMQRQDLSAYVLLGDPAARLPIARCPPGIRHAAPGRVTSTSTEESVRREDAVLAVLRGMATAATMASRMGVSRDEVERWVEVFVDAGRAALARMR